ncbi:hypothetical protein CVIRNUC_010836 [Coccomyxa viridis]|uniref:Small ubiquitin-related modifier n=1 Tax=Coccomyxa viridis TaxID=1274662 RepID=A0AAV1IKE9_9CHLO|nr:hypothetical protein CVIRNUC_010836 [Coccomyxa viridis]
MADEEATQAPQQDVKPEIKQDVQHLTLTVVHQDGSRVPFRVKRTTLFDKLFKAYCQKKSLDQNTLVFMGSDGQRLNAHQTPAEFDMEDGDTIEVQTHAIGGRC